MSIPASCCSLPPVESSYSPKGQIKSLFDNDLPVYETGVADSKLLLFCAYDIFGLHPNTKQFCDKLGFSKFQVVMPDFFRGKPIKEEEFSQGREKIMELINTRVPWEIVMKDLKRLIKHYKSQGVEQFGIFGFCLGGRISTDASIHLSDSIKAGVLIHPSMVTTEDADLVKFPLFIIPAKDDFDFGPFYETLKRKFPKEGDVGHVRLNDVHHGFAAARANLSDEINAKRVNETLEMTHTFFVKHLCAN